MKTVKAKFSKFKFQHVLSHEIGGDRIHVLEVKGSKKPLWKIFKEAIPPKTAYTGKVTRILLNEKTGDEFVAHDYQELNNDDFAILQDRMQVKFEEVVITDGNGETRLYTELITPPVNEKEDNKEDKTEDKTE